MDTNRRQPHKAFEKTKRYYGEMMESYARNRPRKNPSETELEALEQMRQERRSKEEKRRIAFRFITGIFALIFLYVLLHLVNSGVMSFVY